MCVIQCAAAEHVYSVVCNATLLELGRGSIRLLLRDAALPQSRINIGPALPSPLYYFSLLLGTLNAFKEGRQALEMRV